MAITNSNQNAHYPAPQVSQEKPFLSPYIETYKQKTSFKEKSLLLLRLLPVITLLILSLITTVLAIVYSQPILAVLGGLGIICAIVVFSQVFTSSSFQVVSALQKSLSYLNKTNKELETANTELQNKIFSLESQINSLNTISQNFYSLRTLFSEDNVEFKKNIERLKEHIDALSIRSQDAQEVKELIIQSKSLLIELLSWGSSENREEMKALRSEILASITLLKQEKEDLQKNNERAQQSVYQKEKLLIELTTQIECFKQQTTQLTLILEKLTLSLENLNASNIELTRTKTELQGITLSLHEELEKLTHKQE